jgi:histidinol phosphatase-like enzyme (inositol monophosphatase family)
MISATNFSEKNPVQDLSEYVNFFHTLAQVTEPFLLEKFRAPTPLTVDDKGATSGSAFDPVTEADRHAETLLRAFITKHYPTHGILGEEHPPYQPHAPWIWTLDPIDGTRAFITGIPLWGTLVALSYEGIPQVGMINQPYLQERYIGTAQGSFLRSPREVQSLKTRPAVTPAHALGTCTTPDMFKTDFEKSAFQNISHKTRQIRYGTDCYGYAMLALGQVDFVCEASLAPYDVRALIPLIEGAGGVITTWSGESATDGGQILASSSPQLHEELLTILNAPQ